MAGIRHGAEIVAAYLDEHDPSTLVAYGDRLGNGAVFKRLGYLIEALGLRQDDLVAACRERLSAGCLRCSIPVGPSRPVGLSRWGLRLNVAVSPEAAS